MLTKADYYQARELLLQKTIPVSTEQIPLSECAGRVLAEDLRSLESVPPFDRAAYDGYALIAQDTSVAEKEHPIRLKIIEEVPAGAVPTKKVVSGTAVKILTGAPIPIGADTVIPFEKTIFTAEAITVAEPVKQGANIVRKGGGCLRWAVIGPKRNLDRCRIDGNSGCSGDRKAAGVPCAQDRHTFDRKRSS